MHPNVTWLCRGAVVAAASGLLFSAQAFGAAAPCRVPLGAARSHSLAGASRLVPLCPPPSSRPERSTVASPTVEGPVTGGDGRPFLAATGFRIGDVGYSQAEYFISGVATGYTSASRFGTDGRWKVRAATSAAYETRIVVYRPADARDFSGTVFVEWLNVSGGLDSAPDWISAHTEMLREGHAWVGVSAQFVGVEGGTAIIGNAATGLKQADPERYGALHHPGDTFSYDIFSQAGQAVRNPSGIDPLGGLEPEHVIAIGESQSAFRLVTYVNAIDPVARIYDGYLIHSRGGGSAALSQAPQQIVNTPDVVHTRTDVRVPVLTFQTETDLTVLGYFPDRQPDSGSFRLWEVAGTAHADTYTLFVGQADKGDDPDVADVRIASEPIPGIIKCDRPVNSGPQHWVLDAAVAAIERWVRTGTAAPHSPRLETSDAGDILRDDRGNALGGIRTSWVDAPVATLSGLGQTGAGFCGIFGTTVLFDDATLRTLYPSHADYVDAVARSTDRALRAGFLRKADAELIKANAAQSDIGG
ncbi:MAG TPA: alpha/beta hydrolase domain-containing protein [Candidatus Binatia bacterium]|nr:alpha/beta hydrolase domain-containing protein [Candidatus Binatia bacterium]